MVGSIPASPRSLFGRVGVTFFAIFGMSWDVSGSGLETFLDRFGKVLENMSDGVRKSKKSKITGSMLAESGRFRIAFLTYPRSNNIKNTKIRFYRIFPDICYFRDLRLR